MSFSRPSLRSPQNSQGSFLKNSRVSDHSTEQDHSFKFNHSFDLDVSLINSPANKKSIISALATPIRSRMYEKKMKQSQGEQIRRNYLQRVLMNRMINVRLAFKEIEALPVKIFKKGASFGLVKEIIMRVKPNIETSILRTLLYAEESKASNNNTKLKFSRGQNVFVFPERSGKDDQQNTQKRRAIQLLVDISKNSLRKSIKSFQDNLKAEVSKIKYFEKVCCNYEKNREIAFSLIKNLPSMSASKVKKVMRVKQISIICKSLRHKQSFLLKQSIEAIKLEGERRKIHQQYIAKRILSFSNIRQQQCVRQWLLMAKQSNQAQKQLAKVEQEKIVAVNRIVLRNYLKLFKQICRRLHNFKIVATRLGCHSKISEQKALWRLLMNSQRRQTPK